jgi:hypothetical protein
MESFVSFLREWQDLIGAIIGASLPFAFWFITNYILNKQKHKNDLLYLEKMVVSNMNNVLDIEIIISEFITKKLLTLEKNIPQRTSGNSYSIDAAFFPQFAGHISDENYLKTTSKSGFLDNKLLYIYKMSENFTHSLNDFRGQFQQTIQSNTEMAIAKINPMKIQNEMYLRNIQSFRNAVQDELLNNNIPVYLKLLTTAYVTLSEINKRGIRSWRLKFSPSFKYFKTNNQLKEYKDSAFERIEAYIEPLVEDQLTKFRTF